MISEIYEGTEIPAGALLRTQVALSLRIFSYSARSISDRVLARYPATAFRFNTHLLPQTRERRYFSPPRR